MFPRRYFGARMFAPAYFPQSQGVIPVIGWIGGYFGRSRMRGRGRTR